MTTTTATYSSPTSHSASATNVISVSTETEIVTPTVPIQWPEAAPGADNLVGGGGMALRSHEEVVLEIPKAKKEKKKKEAKAKEVEEKEKEAKAERLKKIRSQRDKDFASPREAARAWATSHLPGFSQPGEDSDDEDVAGVEPSSSIALRPLVRREEEEEE
ncbi:uncharacterized protein PG986_000092 [Apiospora aurea]|uniref:Uncharacterized protein n=1 Tax=Apiospora aurea TaxID=335848 RepID=A0ABR1QT37_9PEZI